MGRIFFLSIQKFLQPKINNSKPKYADFAKKKIFFFVFLNFTLIFQVDGAANRHKYYYWYLRDII